MEEVDPIEELHQVRRKILAKAGGTPAGLMRYLRSLEKKEAGKRVKREVIVPASKTPKPPKRRKAVAT